MWPTCRLHKMFPNSHPNLLPIISLFPLSSSPQQQPLLHPSPFALVQNQSTPIPSSSRIKEPKIANPLPFSGKRDDMESFINGCCLYMNSRKSEFPDEDAKIYWILSYMQTGSAKTWRCYDKGLILCHNSKSYSICLFCSVVPPS